jgi:hypothetical protein
MTLLGNSMNQVLCRAVHRLVLDRLADGKAYPAYDIAAWVQDHAGPDLKVLPQDATFRRRVRLQMRRLRREGYLWSRGQFRATVYRITDAGRDYRHTLD